jgi:hypothetical protein
MIAVIAEAIMNLFFSSGPKRFSTVLHQGIDNRNIDIIEFHYIRTWRLLSVNENKLTRFPMID